MIDCQASGIPQPNITWKRAIDEGPRNYHSINEDIGHLIQLSNGSLLIQQAKAEDHGYFLCHVDNGIGGGLSKVIFLTVHGK